MIMQGPLIEELVSWCFEPSTTEDYIRANRIILQVNNAASKKINPNEIMHKNSEV